MSQWIVSTGSSYTTDKITIDSLNNNTGSVFVYNGFVNLNGAKEALEAAIHMLRLDPSKERRQHIKVLERLLENAN